MGPWCVGRWGGHLGNLFHCGGGQVGGDPEESEAGDVQEVEKKKRREAGEIGENYTTLGISRNRKSTKRP